MPFEMSPSPGWLPLVRKVNFLKMCADIPQRLCDPILGDEICLSSLMPKRFMRFQTVTRETPKISAAAD